MFKRFFSMFVLLVSLCFLNIGNTVSAYSISYENEVQIGRSGAINYEAKYGAYSDNRVELIASTLIYKNPKMPRYPLQVRVSNEPTINAFCFPAGYVYITETMLKFLHDDDVVAFTIAHEMGHNAKDHWLKTVDKQTNASILVGVFTNNAYDAQLYGNLVNIAISRGYGFQKEHEADKEAFDYIVNTGEYNPGAGIALFYKLQEFQNSSVSTGRIDMANYINPHPKNETRIQKQIEYLKNYSNGVVDIQNGTTILLNGKIFATITANIGDTESAEYKTAFVAGNLAKAFHENKHPIPPSVTVKKVDRRTKALYLEDVLIMEISIDNPQEMSLVEKLQSLL